AEEHRVAQAAAAEHHVLAARDGRRRAGRTHHHHGLAWLEQRAEPARRAHLQDDERQKALLAIDPGAGERQALHEELGAVSARAGGPSLAEAIALTTEPA